MSNSKEVPRTLEPSNNSSSSLRRPTSSILAPSKLSFGASAGIAKSDNGSSTLLAPSKLSFPGFKASKLSSVVTNHQSEGEAGKETKSEAVATPQKPSFIPLAKEAKIETSGAVPVTATASPPKTDKPVQNSLTSATSVASTQEEKSKENELFVFGQNLTDRAANFSQIKNGSTNDKSKEAAEATEEDSKAEPASTTIPTTTSSSDKEKTKTLSEAAAEYCETRNRKVEYNEVELITGEEDESNVFQMSAKVRTSKKCSSLLNIIL